MAPTESSMNSKSRTKYTILGMLTIAPMSGYEIKKAIQRSTAFFWSESEGQIYPALAQCLEKGWVTCQAASSKTSSREKKTYKIDLPPILRTLSYERLAI